MNSNENIHKWIEQSSIDYITQFIKAWIPLNAWYNKCFAEFPQERERINQLKRNNNSFGRAIDAYMEGTDEQSNLFRSYVGALHFSLEQERYINSRAEYISFRESVKLKNSQTESKDEFTSIKYFLKRKDGRYLGDIDEFKIIVTNSKEKVLLNYSHTAYSWEHLKNFKEYEKLTNPQQEKVKEYFDFLNPIMRINPIQMRPNVNKGEAQNYYRCGSVDFVRNTDIICKSETFAKALVEVLYLLRNYLFHGELTPNKQAQEVYKHAYSILKLLLDKIK